MSLTSRPFRILSILLSGILWVACTNKNKVPSDVLAQADMQKVMWDMIQADRFATQFLVPDSAKDLKTETFRLYEEVFKLHNIDKEEFINSYKFYLSRPDISKVMFDSLSTRANRERSDMYKTDTAKNKPVQPTAVSAGPAPTPVPVPMPGGTVNPPASQSVIRKDSLHRVDTAKRSPIFRRNPRFQKDSFLRRKLMPLKPAE